MWDGHIDPYNHTSLAGDKIIDVLLADRTVLIPLATSPTGKCDPVFHKFLFGKTDKTIQTFQQSRPNTE
jgi:hypothetical protein